MANKIPETNAPAATSPTPAAGANVQAVEPVAKAKMSPEMLASCKAAMKTLKDAMSSMSGDDTKKKKGVQKNLAKFEHVLATAQGRMAELEPLIIEAEKAATPEMQGTALLAQATIGKMHGCLYDLEMMVGSMMQMADEDVADDDAQKAAKSAPAAQPVAAPAATPAAPAPAAVAKGRVWTDAEKALVKEALGKALAGLQDLTNGIDPMQFLELFPVGADGQPGAGKKEDGTTPIAPAMGAAPYTADQGALTKAIEAATAPLKKSLDEAQAAAAEATKKAAEAIARAEKLENATGVSKSLPENTGEAKPVKKGGSFWKGLI